MTMTHQDFERRRLLKGLVGSTVGAALMPHLLSEALAQQDKPRASVIQTLDGDVRVNDRPATVGTAVRSGDTISSGRGSYAIWTLEGDAFLIRQNSRVQISGGQAAATLFRLLTGRLLSVFDKGGQRTLTASTATIGIRGTGVYLEAYRDRAYFCLCYGAADVETRAGMRESLVSKYHETPRLIYADNRPQPMISGPVVNHSDAELIMLEGLLGRRPPQDFLANVRY
jgi:hypothetical protein